MANYKIVSHAGAGLPLNVATTTTISRRTNVNIWSDTGSNDQKWSITSLGTNQQVKSLNNLSYMLNANTSTWNCDVYTSNADTYINFILVSTDVYRLQLASDTTKYLTAEGTTSGSNVKWAALNNTTAQQWKITTVSTNDSGSSVATDADQLRKEFQKVGDYDGAYGLQCVDIVRWYVDTYTTLNSTSGHGKDLVANLANKYGLTISSTPKAPGIFSVAGGYHTWGCSGSTYGHTGVVVSVNTTKKTATVIHTGSSLADENPNSWKSDYSYPASGVTFVYLGNYMK